MKYTSMTFNIPNSHKFVFITSVFFISILEIAFWGLFSIIISVSPIQTPAFISIFIDKIGIGYLLIIVVFLRFIMQSIHAWLMHFIGFGYLMNLRDDIVKGVINSRYQNYESIGKARLSSNIILNSAIFVDAVMINYMKIISDFMSLFIVSAIIVFLSGIQSLIIIILLLLLAVVGIISLRGTLSDWSRAITASSNMLNKLTDYLLYSLKEIKVNKIGESVINQHHSLHKDISSIQLKIRFTQLLPRYIVEAIFFGLIAIAVVYANGQSDSSKLEIMSSIAFLVVAGMRALPLVNQIMLGTNGVRAGAGAKKQIFEDLQLLKHGTEVLNFKDYSMSRSNLKGLLNFRNVAFSYEDEQVISDFSCNLERGQIVLFSGPSGSGKSTALDLLLGLRIPNKGSIETQENLDIFYVSQHPFFPACTIKEYFHQSCPKIPWTSIQEYLFKFNLDFLAIDSQFYLGETASSLSGGQRQLLCLIVAILLQPDIVIFDETTSGLDSKNEELFLNMVSKEFSNSLLVMISHRPKTEEIATQILKFPT
ncbi:ABC transporter ATP-binding protein/permease [Gammaproteobacteria bacterium]|nr:ABC transporter ATP-binding protein/permease [Gammaproteobacteria bacterium]